MRLLTAILLLLLVPATASPQILGIRNRKVFSSGGGAISYASNGCTATTSTTSLTCSLAIASSGQTIVFFVTGGVGTVSVADSGTYTSLAAISGYPCTFHSTSQNALWIETGAVSGTHSISVTLGTSAAQMVAVVATGGSVDATPSAKCPTSFGTTATTNSATSTHTGDLALMFTTTTGAAATWTFSSTPIALTQAYAIGYASSAYGTVASVTTTDGVATLGSGVQWATELVLLH